MTAAVLALVLVGLLVTCTVIWLQRRGSIDEAPVIAGRQEAIDFFSLDYRQADHDISRVLSRAADPFKRSYREKSPELQQQLVSDKLVLTATVPEDGAALEYLHDNTARVLVAVDVTTKAGAQASSDSRYRARIDLRRVGSTWLTTGVNQVG